jgi:large subunit ribosomal protein L24e
MVEKRNCSFCGNPIEPGTGKMYIRKDGTIYTFCSNKCKKNRIDLGRVPRRTKWTVRYSELKASSLKRKKGTEDDEPEEEAKSKKRPVKRKSLPKDSVSKTPRPVKKSAPKSAEEKSPVKGEKAQQVRPVRKPGPKPAEDIPPPASQKDSTAEKSK